MESTEATLVHQFLEKSARRYPEHCALVHDKVRATYARIDREAGNLASWLVSGSVQKGDRIVILLRNGLEYVVSYYGILKSGAVAVPLSPDTKPDSLLPILEILEPKVLIVDRKMKTLLSRIDLGKMGVKALVYNGNADKREVPKGLDAKDWQTVAEYNKSGNRPLDKLTDGDLASIIFTSGSTGRPKGVMLTHRNIVANVVSITQYLKLTSNDVQMVVLPFFYVMGKSLLNSHFAVGGRVVINNRFMFPADVIRQMVEERVTGFSGVPSTYSHLLHKSPLAEYRNELESLRYCSQAGGHMPKSVKEELQQVLPGQTKLYVMYGATEAAARLSYVEPEDLNRKIESIGKPINGVRLKILDEDGGELPCGEVGEIVASGKNIFQGYWRDPEATLKVLSRHGYHTGDLGYMDEEGYFFLCGRRDHQLKIGGHRINPLEIEEAIIATGLCVEVVALGLKDPVQGQRLVALVVPRNNDFTPTMIARECSLRLPRHKIPARIECVAQLVKNTNGKVDRGACLEMLENLLAQDVQRQGCQES